MSMEATTSGSLQAHSVGDKQKATARIAQPTRPRRREKPREPGYDASILAELEPHLGFLKDPNERGVAVAMVRLVHDVPGPSFRELLRHVPTGEIRSRFLLQLLVQAGVLVEETVLGARRVYPADLFDPDAQFQAAVLRDPDAARLYRLLAVTWRQADLFRQAQSWGWKRERTRRLLQRLHQASLVRRCGGTTRYPSLQGVKPLPQAARFFLQINWADCRHWANQDTLHR